MFYPWIIQLSKKNAFWLGSGVFSGVLVHHAHVIHTASSCQITAPWPNAVPQTSKVSCVAYKSILHGAAGCRLCVCPGYVSSTDKLARFFSFCRRPSECCRRRRCAALHSPVSWIPDIMRSLSSFWLSSCRLSWRPALGGKYDSLCFWPVSVASDVFCFSDV